MLSLDRTDIKLTKVSEIVHDLGSTLERKLPASGETQLEQRE